MNDFCRQLKYPVGIQSFTKIREEDYIYVDKTDLVHELINQGGYFFLSRPRRFGKSLLLSTIEAFFSGKRELFKGLAIDRLAEEWDEYPVLHLDLNNREYSEYESLIKELSANLEKWEALYGDEKSDRDVEERFAWVIENAHKKTGRQVVILVDEYDKPMLNAIDDEPLADRFRNTLKAFYSNLKSLDEHIKFAMLTGVARFSKLSIFSDLNNLRDITFETGFSTICGITSDEIEKYFAIGINCLAEKHHMSVADVRKELKYRYDGYHFSKDLTDIYNPFSLVNVFAKNEFGNYWADSGTPSYLVKLLRKHHYRLQELEHCDIDSEILASGDILSGEVIPKLYQSGYLTIKQYDSFFSYYELGYPNKEVEDSFVKFLRPIILGKSSQDSEFDNRKFARDVLEGKPREFMTRLDSLLRTIPHIGQQEPTENFFQNAIYIIFKMVGIYTRMEDHTSDGRIDLSVETDNFVYIFEFKRDGSPEKAMGQILDKQYWKKFNATGKKIFLIAANFNSAERAVSDFLIREIQPY